MSQDNQLRGARCLGLGILLLACSAQHNQLFAQGAVAADTAVFAAVLRALVSDTSYPVRPIVADPRPLVRKESVTSLEPSNYAPVTGTQLLARRVVMRQLGVEPGDASFPAWCGSIMVTGEKSSDPMYAGCPSTGRLVVALGLPRTGDRTRKTTDRDSRWRTVRVIVAGIGPNGVSADLRDYVLDKIGGVWSVVKWKRIGFWE